MFTTFWSSGAQSSFSSLCSTLAHIVFLMSNLILNLKPATTYRETNGNKCVFTAWNPPHQIPLPVWWRGRQCTGQTGEWSQTWNCTWWWPKTEEILGPLSTPQSPPHSPGRVLSLEWPDHLWVFKKIPKCITDSCQCKNSSSHFHKGLFSKRFLKLEAEHEKKKSCKMNRPLKVFTVTC